MARGFLGTYDLFADALLLFECGVHVELVKDDLIVGRRQNRDHVRLRDEINAPPDAELLAIPTVEPQAVLDLIRLGNRPTEAEVAWEDNRALRGLMSQPLYRNGYVYILDKQFGLNIAGLLFDVIEARRG